MRDDDVELRQRPDGTIYLVRGDTSSAHAHAGANAPPESGATGSTEPSPADRRRPSSRWAVGSLRFFGAWIVAGLIGLPLLAVAVSLTLHHGMIIVDDRTLTWPLMLLTTLGALVGAPMALAIESIYRRLSRDTGRL